MHHKGKIITDNEILWNQNFKIKKQALVMSSIIISGFLSVGMTWKNFNLGSLAIRWTAWLTDSIGLQQWKQQNRLSWGHKTAGSSSKIVSPA